MNRWIVAGGCAVALAFTGAALGQPKAAPALAYTADGRMIAVLLTEASVPVTT